MALVKFSLYGISERRTISSSSKNTKSSLNPVDTYMDSRVNTIDMAKQSVQESNKKVEEQDKAMKALLGK